MSCVDVVGGKEACDVGEEVLSPPQLHLDALRVLTPSVDGNISGE